MIHWTKDSETIHYYSIEEDKLSDEILSYEEYGSDLEYAVQDVDRCNRDYPGNRYTLRRRRVIEEVAS